MKQEIILIPLKSPFDYRSALNSHGWVDLLPNIHDPAVPSFSRAEEVPSGKVVFVAVSADGMDQDQQIKISVNAPVKMTSGDRDYLISAVSHMLRLDEDFTEFYALCKTRGGVWKKINQGIGRLLRSPTVFEDLVKVICTTNVQWGGTKRMARELVEAFGCTCDHDPLQKTFPSPPAIARYSFDEFQQKVRLGYRADYIYRLARQFAEGELSSSDFQNSQISTEDIRSKLLAIKGIGSYAAASMLMLLGRYDHIPVDTVFRQFMAEKYFIDKPFSQLDALKVYDDWGQWKYLAYWFDMINFESPPEPK
jgi:3-methyladenine DNA glycosylase/8-oxoguanine DNA glycosylase